MICKLMVRQGGQQLQEKQKIVVSSPHKGTSVSPQRDFSFPTKGLQLFKEDLLVCDSMKIEFVFGVVV